VRAEVFLKKKRHEKGGRGEIFQEGIDCFSGCIKENFVKKPSGQGTKKGKEKRT